MANQLILVDGSSYLYRAYYALPPLTNSKDQPTGAIYGVINMLRRLIHDHPSTHIAVVFDAKAKTFRHALYEHYKAHRPKMPEDLQAQVEPIHDIIRAMGIPLIMIEGVEADDVIGSLAHLATEQKLDTLISTGDKDLAQLVNKHITLINTMSGAQLNERGVEEKFGVPPKLIVDYLTLVGDTSDNIPGVEKVGPKTAVKWLQTYGSLDNLIQHIDEIKGVVGENLRKFLPQIEWVKQLATIKIDVDLNVTIADLTTQPANTQRLTELFKALELKTWLAELEPESPIDPPHQTKSPNHYQAIFSGTELDQLIHQLNTAKQCSVDTETTSLNYMDAEIVGVSFAITPHEAFYIPLAHDYPDAPKQLNRQYVLQQLKPILENAQIKKIGQHIKYDAEVFANEGIQLQGIAYDTMLESYVLDSTLTRHDLESLALKYLHWEKTDYETITGKGAKQIPFSAVAIETATQYAAADADAALKLHEYFYPKIKSDKKLHHIFSAIEMPLVPVLIKMERTGVLIDAKILEKQSETLGHRMQELEKEAYHLADAMFNLDSPKQLQEIFYEKLHLPILKKTPTGQPSTAEPILQELALDYPLPRVILEYRTLSKLKSTYTDQLPKQMNAKTGRVHTSYHQAITSTGRLSSTSPNLQNIPIRSKEGRRIRQAFIAPPGYQILAADYSQIELHIMAHLSQDKGLLDAFSKGLDIHKATAAEIFAIDLDQVTQDQRRKAKAINFGLIYGMSAFGLAKQIGVERVTAQIYMDAYFAKYPAVLTYMNHTREIAHKQGYVETLLGRRLYVPDIRSKNMMQRKAAERAAINAPMQGTAADIIKLAMIQIDDWINTSGMDVKMIMQVHDELVFEVAKKDLGSAKKSIEHHMADSAKLSVPLVVDIGIGDNWDEAH
ncbi:MAG: DNA polymerase I [Gammaproteobacteria bacterium GWF2_41_13]|nr:MAG: DNA polymerase I [Gammaproteobacteria bacterium GWF2_41_13]